MHKPKLWQQVISYAALIVITLFVLTPIWGLVYPAFDGGIKGHPSEFRVWPEEFTLSVFQEVWERPSQTLSFGGVLKNSLLVAGGADVAFFSMTCQRTFHLTQANQHQYRNKSCYGR